VPGKEKIRSGVSYLDNLGDLCRKYLKQLEFGGNPCAFLPSRELSQSADQRDDDGFDVNAFMKVGAWTEEYAEGLEVKLVRENLEIPPEEIY